MSTKKGQPVVTDLIGAVVSKREVDEPGGQQWASKHANLSGQYIGTVHAVWVDNDGSVKLLVADTQTPSKLFETYAVCVRFERLAR